MNIKDKIDEMLVHFGHDKCNYEDEVYYFTGDLQGYSLAIEDRDYTYATIGGDRTERKPHYVILREYMEHNYPHEPDYTDVEEVEAHLTINAAIAGLLHLQLNDKIDGYFEYLNDVAAEEHYANML